ncbi:hypothetical protein [Lacinutrix sp.]|uniref:hypothetical protein n=1 Tax=Lacinutrix sp. TaxID=1937692 RepID=UPI0025C0B1A9|nr:hypothetical protein [Lacinutrix sp.]
MKSLLVAITFLFGLNCFAQEDIDGKKILSFNCEKKSEFNSKTNTLILTGNVNLKTSVFEFVNADKIVLNQNTNEVIVSGNYKVNNNGGTIQTPANVTKNILKYKIGEKIAYVE